MISHVSQREKKTNFSLKILLLWQKLLLKQKGVRGLCAQKTIVYSV